MIWGILAYFISRRTWKSAKSTSSIPRKLILYSISTICALCVVGTLFNAIYVLSVLGLAGLQRAAVGVPAQIPQSSSISQQNQTISQSTFSPTPNYPATIAILQGTPTHPSPAETFPVGTPQTQLVQYACFDDEIEILTFRDGEFVSSGFIYNNGNEVKVYGQVGNYYMVGVDEKQKPFYVRTSNICAQSPIIYLTPTRTPTKSSVVSVGRNWEADFHDMVDREITICAKVADVRGGPDMTFPVLRTMSIGERATTYGWVRQWFFLGTDDNKQDYFVANTDVCALEQTQSSQQKQPQGGCGVPSRETTYDQWLEMKKCAGDPEMHPNTAESKANYNWDTFNEQLGAGTLKPGDLAPNFGPCDTYLYNQWAKGKSTHFVPECTPTPRAP